MSNLTFVSHDLDALGPTITSDLSAVGEASNLLTKQPSVNWISGSGTEVNLYIDIGQAHTFDTVWLGYTNLSDNATFRIRTGDSQAAVDGFPDYDSDDIEFSAEGKERPHLLHVLSSAQENSWVRITLTDSTIGHFEAGRLYIAERTELPINIDYDWSITPLFAAREEETESGAEIAHARWHGKRLLEFDVRMYSKIQMFQIIEPIILKHGHDKDILSVIDTDEADVLQSYMVYGRFTDDYPIRNPNFNLFARHFQITEFI